MSPYLAHYYARVVIEGLAFDLAKDVSVPPEARESFEAIVDSFRNHLGGFSAKGENLWQSVKKAIASKAQSKNRHKLNRQVVQAFQQWIEAEFVPKVRLLIDLESQMVYLDGQWYGPGMNIDALRILKFLSEHIGHRFTLEQILMKVFPGRGGHEKTASRQISRLCDPIGSLIKSGPNQGHWLELPAIAPKASAD